MPDTAPVSRIERRKTEFRDRITDAALKLFAENGVADTSVASIIKEADIAHKTFFNHFPTKDHLLQHIVNSHSEHAYSFFREAFKRHTDPKKRIEYCLMSIARSLEKFDPQQYKEMITFYFISSASTHEFRKTQKESFSDVINQILQDAKDKKLLRPGFTVETLSEIVVGICVSTLLNWSVEDDFPIISRMKNAVKFINQSVFVEV
ncbi:MAG TPA: TetR/AcrR family transcriptional regulator [Pseudomonadales bacterium]|nr:TetR/AcrR family transcriptional regulator [Pseudomonadales bacterium]